MSATTAGSALSPTSNPRLSRASTTATLHRIIPMATEAAPSRTGASSAWLRNTPRKATVRPARAAESSNTTVNRLGSLLVWTVVQMPRPTRVWRNSRQATVNEMLSKTAARPRTT